MCDIERDVLKWHKNTFPNATIEAVQEKLEEEVGEFFEVVEKRDDAKPVEYWDELADVIIVNMVFVNKTSNGEICLADIIRRKLEINKKRQWGKETENGDRPRVKP